ncbi:MAG: Na(+)/H(+) antiporter subunit B [Bacillota bacterium]|jgi:multicomponent Na+:H+ antiporter subunit B
MGLNNDVILQTVSKVAFFIILAFAIHLFIGGHHNPGGGFVGGLVVASALTLLILAFDLKSLEEVSKINYQTLGIAGVIIAVGTGMSSLIFHEPFLNQTFGIINLPILGETEYVTAIVFDTGVALAVLGTALSIITTISEDVCKWRQ